MYHKYHWNIPDNQLWIATQAHKFVANPHLLPVLHLFEGSDGQLKMERMKFDQQF